MDCLTVKIDDQNRELCALGGSLSVTKKHYMLNESIAWSYQQGDALSVSGAVLTKERSVLQTSYLQGKKQVCYDRPFGLRCYIYSEKPSGDMLKFAFSYHGKETQWFLYTLNFTGWKEISLPYERGYMQGRFDKRMDGFTLTALSGSGRVYMEDLRFCQTINPNPIYGQMAAQVKDLPLPTRRGAVAELGRFDTDQLRPVFPAPSTVSAEEKKGFAAVKQKYFALMGEVDLPPFRQGEIGYDQAVQVFSDHHITDRDGIVTGVRIANPSLYAKALKAIALHFSQQKDPEDAERFFLMWRHLMDQNTTINWYHGRGVGSGLLLMRQELKNRGLLETAVAYLKDAYHFSRIYATAGQGPYTHARFEDTDVIGMDLPSTLACILLMEDTPKKAVDMRHFTYYIENYCLGLAPGLMSGYKPDGTAFHHCGYIRQYETVANYSLSRVLYMLADTPFMIGREAADRFRNILWTEFITYNGVYETFALSQYAFDAFRDTSVVEFAHTANALKDKELARMYLTLAQCSQKERQNPNYQMFLEQGLLPYEGLTVHKTLTYAAAAFHKRQNWTAAVRGHSKYVYPMEVWPDAGGPGARYTAFSLFRSFGFLEILYPPDYEGGTNNGLQITKGFDYRRWPGSTAVHVPLRQIKSTALMVEDEWAEWLLSDTAFAGGLDTPDQNGVFALQLHGPEKYGLESFYAAKSYHFFEDMVLCLGSGISCGIQGYDTETTLFQDFGKGAEQKGCLLLDNRKNGYWVAPEYQARLFSQRCRSRDMKDSQDTVGERTFALISHGKAPKNAKYAYLLKVNTSMEEMEQMDFAKEIQILRQDEKAHIAVLFGRRSYVFFQQMYDLEDSVIESVSGGCLVSVYRENGKTVLAVCDPDLRFYLGESEDYDLNRRKEEKSIYGRFWVGQESIPSRIWMVLKQELSEIEITAGNAKVIQTGGGRTILEFVCRDGMTNAIRF